MTGAIMGGPGLCEHRCHRSTGLHRGALFAAVVAVVSACSDDGRTVHRLRCKADLVQGECHAVMLSMASLEIRAAWQTQTVVVSVGENVLRLRECTVWSAANWRCSEATMREGAMSPPALPDEVEPAGVPFQVSWFVSRFPGW